MLVYQRVFHVISDQKNRFPGDLLPAVLPRLTGTHLCRAIFARTTQPGPGQITRNGDG